ncbi:MAG: 30S ribosomal protein S12 methylthiotransferase RimO [Actinomycetia bacterium]|nr:30S ribosomal protein S12 methylthiotransferase RimO [Actinomycetes bacterium]
MIGGRPPTSSEAAVVSTLVPDQPRTFHVVTLGCPKNQVDSEKLVGTLLADGMAPTDGPEGADLVVVNTCAFVEEARQESVETILDLDERKARGAELVVTGCLAERHGTELSAEMPEVDRVAGFGVPVTLTPKPGSGQPPPPGFDLLNLPRPAAPAPWAYVKIAEGCDRQCGFCAIPSFRGPQRSRSISDIVTEVEQLGAREIVLVAQDLASFGRDQGVGERQLSELVAEVGARVDRVRLLYLYPSDLDDRLIDSVLATGVPYFDLSLQHVSPPLMRRMRRWGDGVRFLDRIEAIRARDAGAAFRSNFIVGYPGETEADHDALLEFVEAAQLDWCGFFSYSEEAGTYSVTLDGQVPQPLMAERLGELTELQDMITARKRDALIGRVVEVLVDRSGVARSHREAPEIDGIIEVPTHLEVGTIQGVTIVEARGPDLVAEATGRAGQEGVNQ